MRKTGAKIQKSKFNINPVYSEGMKLRQGVLEASQKYYDAVSTPANTGMFNTVSSDEAPELDYSEKYNLYPDTDENGEIVTKSEEEGVFDKIFGSSDDNTEDKGSTFWDRLITSAKNPIDPWRKWWERKYESQKSSEETSLYDVTSAINDINTAQQYIDLLDKYKKLQDQLSIQYKIDPNGVDELKQEMNILATKIKSKEDYIKDNWKRSDVFLNTFTDMSDMGFFENMKYKAAGDPYTVDKSGTFRAALDNAANYVMSNISSVKNMIKNAGLEAYNLFGEDKWALTRSMLRNSVDDEYDKSKFFDGADKHLGNLGSYIQNKRNDLNASKKEYDRLFDERSAQVLRTTNITKNGNWLFDPRKIDKHYNEIQESETGGSIFEILDPTRWAYSIAETGSSFADMETFLLLSSADRIAGGLANAAETVIGPSGKGKLLSGLLKTAAFTTQGAGLYLSTQTRKVETQAEVADAYVSRIVNELYSNRNINADKVLKSIDDFIDKNSGLQKDTKDSMNIEDKLRLALAYNINTGDPEFEQLKQKSRAGLSKIYNENETLSTMDYIQAMPYMTYTGSAIKEALGGGKLKPYVKVPSISEKIGKYATAMSDAVINKIFSKEASSIYKKVTASHASKWLGNQIKKLGFVGVTEGIEEGQQNLLQSRYQRGEYDDYAVTNSMFNLPSAFNDVGLAADAVASYIGINYGDPDNGNSELRKAMNIGLTTGGVFHASHVINPISNLLGKNDPTTARYLKNQLKNDAVLRKLVGENYSKAQDDAHIKIFNEKLNRGGDVFKMMESLKEMKRFKGDLVEDEYIDKDIELLQATNFVRNNSEFKNILKDLGIINSKEDELKTVQNAVRAIVDSNTVSSLVNEQKKKLAGIKDDFSNVVDLYVENIEENEVPDHLKDKYNLYKPVIDKLRQSYQTYTEELKNFNALVDEKSKQDEDLINQAKKEIDYDRIKRETEQGSLDPDILEQDDIDEQLDKKVKQLVEKKKKKILDEKDYLTSRINLLYNLQTLPIIKQVSKMFKDRATLLKYVNEELGLDLNIDRIRSISDNMQDMVQEYERQIKSLTKEQDDAIDKENERIDEYNKKAEAYNRKNRNKKDFERAKKQKRRKHVFEEFQDQLKGHVGNMFQDFEKLTRTQFINEALLMVYMPYVQAYKTGRTNPDLLIKQTRPLKWSELSLEQREDFRNELAKKWQQEDKDIATLTEAKVKYEYQSQNYDKSQEIKSKLDSLNKKKKEFLNKPEQERTVDEAISIEKESDELQKEAAKQLIQDDLNKKKERRKIAHREFLSDGGITNDDIQNAENGDVQAREEIEQATGENKNETSSAVEEKPITDETVSEEPVITPQDEVERKPVTEDIIEPSEESDLYDDGSIAQNMSDILNKGKRQGRKEKKIDPKDSEKPGVRAAQESEGIDVVGNISTDGTEIKPVEAKETAPSDETESSIPTELPEEQRIQNALDSVLRGSYTIDDVQTIPQDTYIFNDFKVIVDKQKNKDGRDETIITIVDDTNQYTGINIPTNYVQVDKTTGEPVGLMISNDGKVTVVSITDEQGNVSLLQEKDSRNITKETEEKGSDKIQSEQYDEESDQDIIDETPSDEDDSKSEKPNQVEQQEEEPVEDTDDSKKSSNTEQVQINTDDEGNVPGVENQDFIEFDQNELINIDQGFITTEDVYSGIGGEYYDQYNVQNKDSVERDFISQTFFYLNSQYDKDGKQNGPISLKVNGKELELDYHIQEGFKLAQKLTQKGWFQSTKKFYIVSGNDAATQYNPQSYTVSLVMYDEKEKKAYVATMKATGKYEYQNSRGEIIEENGKQKLMGQLRFIGVDDSKYKKVLEDLKIYYYKHYNNIHNEELNLISDTKLKTEASNWFDELSIYDNKKIQIYSEAREKASNGKSRILSEEDIRKNIEELEKRRLEIIDAYCDKKDGKYIIPTKIRKNVIPNDPRISNGSIVSNKKDETTDLPVFKPITGPEANFGIDSTIDGIQNQLNNGDIVFGFGKGMFGTPAYGITSFDGNVSYKGKGLAGKIYLIYKTNNGDDIPLMLREKKFNKIFIEGKEEIIDPKNLQLRINPKNGLLIDNSQKPSAAEVLLYMLTGKLNEQYYPESNADENIRKAFVDLFVHNGEKTLTTTKSSSKILNRFKYYADKRLAWELNENTGQYELSIVLTTRDGNRQYRRFTKQDLFSNTDESNSNLKNVIYAISKNMHWNTDIEALQSKFDNNILTSLRSYFQTTGEDEFSFMGLDEFTFKKEDLFDDNDGRLTKKDISVLAWLLKTGKLMSDISPQIFKDPFIYATGVQKQSPAKEAIKPIKEKLPKGKEVIEEKQLRKAAKQKLDLFEKQKVDNLRKKFGILSSRFEVLLANTLDSRKALIDAQSTNSLSIKYGGLNERLMLDFTPSSKNEADIISEIESKIKEFADKKGYSIKSIDSSLLNKFGPKLHNILSRTHIPYIWLYNDGHVRISLETKTSISSTIQSTKSEKSNKANAVTGVFERTKGKGKIDVNKAKAWLNKVLGLNEDQIFISNAVFKTITNEDAYGFVTTYVNTLQNDITEGIIGLSKQGGAGVEYHEAFHYVNLLLHDEFTRTAIYTAYAKTHKDAEKLKFKEIEELLAEDFRKYAIHQNDTRLSARISRFFERIFSFINVFNRNKDIIRQCYEAINKGQYKNTKLNQKSLNEFNRIYGNYVNQSDFQIPTVSQKVIDSLQYVDDYHKFYKVAEALANKMLDFYAITRLEDMKRLSGSKFKDFIEELRNNADEDTIGIIDDVYNNQKAFFNIVEQAFKQYGITVKIKKIKQIDENDQNGADITATVEESEKAEKADVGDRPDNTWDVFQFEVSKKDNVATRAKLFLSHIQKAKLVPNPENPQIKDIEYETDDLLNSPVYMPFGEVWTKILNDMWDIESYSAVDKNNNYLPSSLRGKIKQRSLDSAFYRILDQKLGELDGNSELETEPDIEMQNQIYSTVKSQCAQMSQIWLTDPQKKFTKSEDLNVAIGDLTESYQSQDSNYDEISDVDRIFEIINDNALKAKRSLPRQWSNSAMLAGLIDNVNGQTVVNKVFAKHVKTEYDSLYKAVVKPTKKTPNPNYPKTEDQFYEAYDDIMSRLNALLNYMAIPSDENIIEDLLSKMFTVKDGDIKGKFEALSSMITNSKDQGGLRNIVKTISDSSNRPYLSVGRNSRKDISKIYMQFKSNSWMCELAESYNNIHPSSADFSVKGPDGSMHYPINQNNHMSDEIRRLNTDKQHVENMMKSPYCKHSVLLQQALDLDENTGKDQRFILNAFIGMKDVRRSSGKDYFGITFLEDYLAKMTMTANDMLILPTMADKKTWYSISQKLMKLPHDLITYDMDSEEGLYKARRFSNNTLKIFKGYFLDEIESLKQYYSRQNIEYLIKNQNQLRKNFHGKVKNGRMDFTGNGGLFRYMYDLENENGYNLNQLLEAKFELQKQIEDKPSKYGGLDKIREGKFDLDGFELVRKELDRIEKKFKNDDVLYDSINKWLFNKVDTEISKMTKDTPYKLGYLADGIFVPDAIPSHILGIYQKKFAEAGISTSKNPYRDSKMTYNYALSAIANHVASSMISIIEIEKVFSGDPAFYKYKYQKGKQAIPVTFEVNGKTRTYEIETRLIKEKDTDKIKRLGALLSPGQNIRTDYSNNITSNPKYKSLIGDKYTVMNICDFEIKSKFITESLNNFKRQTAINVLRNKQPEWFKQYIKDNKYKTAEDFFTQLYKDYDLYIQFSDVKNHKKENKKEVSEFFKQVSQVADVCCSPYGVGEDSFINVSDAQVIIRPELYRKIRIGIGRWSFEEDETGYSDEKAYRMLEEDGSWMHDSEKAKIVSKLELFPLKMSYFQNDPTIISSSEEIQNYINLPIYNKMAIFPMFKYMTRSKSGEALYNRMNDEKKGFIDMIAFESAVKVGDNQNKYKPYNNDDIDLNNFNEDGLMLPSDKRLDDKNNIVIEKHSRSLPIQIQSLNGLRMQLNTDAHKHLERSIGTQMFKIAFSNILDDQIYGINKTDANGKPVKLRNGNNIKHDVMSCINALTEIGRNNIIDKFKFVNGIADRDVVDRFIRSIVENNGLGIPTKDIIDNYGVAASSVSRQVFEQSATSVVNGEVIKIDTNGGSVVQQSTFGLIGYNRDNDDIDGWTKDKYRNYNQGNEIKWLAKNNTMEVMLSINLFRSMLPLELQEAPYEVRRQWLVDHDLIKGLKSESYWQYTEDGKVKKVYSNPQTLGVGYRIPTQGMSSMFAFVCADVLPETSGDIIVVPREFTAQTGSDFDVDKIYIATKSYVDGILQDLNAEQKQKIQDIYKDTSIKNKQNAVTELLASCDKKAVQNRLLQNYIDIITDVRNYASSRGSIDTITAKIKKELLPLLQESAQGYVEAGNELLPSFQLRRKMEFSTGKSGIGPFALNITNMALTQFSHLTMKYTASVADYKLGDLDAITGQDDLFIADWLSAMVNAHVDVAKDPYIFDMNINSSTYKYINFLLRAGKGLSTFTFIAQPAIKKLANLMQNSNSMYGGNIRSRKQREGSNKFTKEDPFTKTMNYYLLKLKDSLKNIDEEIKDEKQKKEVLQIAQELIKKIDTSEETDGENTTNKKQKSVIKYTDIFDVNYAKNILNNPGTILYYIHQVKCLKTWRRLEPFANELSKLVKVSRIDTEKFGNNIASQLNYLNTYNGFKYGEHKVTWYIKPANRRLSDHEISEQIKQKGSDYALKKYFGESFLDKKLNDATYLVRTILRNQLFTATPNFQNVFKTIMMEIAGIKDTNSDDLIYEDVTDEKTISEISTAMDNVMRYSVLKNSKPVTFNVKDFNYTEFAGPIDFTCNGDIEEVNNRMRRLMFGDPNGKTLYDQNSIFENVAAIIDMLKNPDMNSEEEVDWVSSTGLVDFDGNITNELLNFLRPQTASIKFPVGRMLMAKSTFGISGQEESILVSAFNDLLENNNETIRKLARDLVFYAYYSCYDTNIVNNFFKFVPPYYRQQYDNALKRALYKSKSGLDQILKPEFDDRTITEDFIDVICRNYWYNDNIVPTKTIYESKKGMEEDGSTIAMVLGKDTQESLTGKRTQRHNVKGLIISKNINQTPYIKVQKGNDYYLYKHIGFVKDNNGDVQYNVFAIVPKLGVHEGELNQYEFASMNGQLSLFDKNALPDTFRLENLIFNLSRYIDNVNETLKKKAKENTVPKSFHFEKFKHVDLQFVGYTETSGSSKEQGIISNEDGKISFSYVQNVDSILNGKQFVFDLSKNIEDQLKSFKEKYSNGQSTPEVSVIGSAPKFEVSEKEVDNKINQFVEQYKQQLLQENSNINKEQLQMQSNDYKEDLNREQIKKYILQSKVNSFVENNINKLLDISPIFSIYSDGKPGVGEAAMRFAQTYSDNIVSDIPGHVVVDSRNTSEENLNSLYKFIDKFNSSTEFEFMSDETKQQLQDVEDMIHRVHSVDVLEENDSKKTKSKTKDTSSTIMTDDVSSDDAQNLSGILLGRKKKQGEPPTIIGESDNKISEGDTDNITKC